ncbi:LmeA family phospholipid-binding protein [Kribbella deserti]|uniref:DUF2993 domain-containing protein n=1 Tax=Kribbella deserti TaxID=1926257 RepID=A0ABV6QTD2_9ACTN
MSSTRPRRRLRSLLITLVVLAGLAFAADRVAESIAEDRVAAIAQREAAQYDVQASDTSVEVAGLAFLPQLARGEFDRITLTMRDPVVSSVPAEDLTVVMTGIDVPREALTGGTSAAVRANAADLRLRVSPDAIAKLAARSGLNGLTLRIADGELQARIAIRGFEAAATVQPQTENGRIKLVVDNDAPAAVRKAVNSLLARGIPLPRLPFGTTLQRIGVDGQSVLLTATATNLDLATP